MRTLTLATLLLASGCITTNTLRPDQLSKLDGYDASAATQPSRMLETTNGKQVEFSSNKMLELQSGDGAALKGRLQHLELDARLGLLSGALTGGTKFSLDPSSVTSMRVSSISPWKTVLLVACIITGGLAATAGVAVAAVAFGHPFSGLGFQ